MSVNCTLYLDWRSFSQHCYSVPVIAFITVRSFHLSDFMHQHVQHDSILSQILQLPIFMSQGFQVIAATLIWDLWVFVCFYVSHHVKRIIVICRVHQLYGVSPSSKTELIYRKISWWIIMQKTAEVPTNIFSMESFTCVHKINVVYKIIIHSSSKAVVTSTVWLHNSIFKCLHKKCCIGNIIKQSSSKVIETSTEWLHNTTVASSVGVAFQCNG